MPEDELDFEIFHEFKREGMTDYLALPLIFSDGRHNPMSFQSDAPGGFSDEDIAALQDIVAMMAPIVESESAHRIARQVVRTYVGRRTGDLVLSGAITRGSGETINAVIWYCDLRGFTELTDRLPRDQLLDLLNDYYEIMAEAIGEQGGEVLKFVGDAMLAILALGDDAGGDAAACCTKAVAAARSARQHLAEHNEQRRADGLPIIEYGLALHLGEVHYGNIGAPERLDFTVIGPAVNHAARLEELGAELGQPIVASASVAAAENNLTALGPHKLRGVSEPQEVFALPE